MQSKKFILSICLFILTAFFITACSDSNDNNTSSNEPKTAKIIMNDYTRYALFQDGSLYVWGNNEHGQLGVNNTVEYVKTPTKLSGINGAVNKVYTGDSVYVITNDNAVYSFGSNEFWFEYVQYNGLLGRDGSNYEPLQVLFEK